MITPQIHLNHVKEICIGEIPVNSKKKPAKVKLWGCLVYLGLFIPTSAWNGPEGNKHVIEPICAVCNI